MAQANYVQEGVSIDYTPGSAVDAGDVVVIGDSVGIAKLDIAANALGALAVEGVYDIVHTNAAIADRADVYWDADGNPYGGTAGTGAASTDSTVGPYIGRAVAAAGATDATVRVKLISMQERANITNRIADPGNAGAIPVTKSGHVEIVTAGAETRTLAVPTFVGQELLVVMKTDGGDGVITVAAAINQTGNNTITLNDAGDTVRLMGIKSGSNLRWRVVVNDGAALSTV